MLDEFLSRLVLDAVFACNQNVEVAYGFASAAQ